MESVKDVFQCQWCLSEIADPVLLPCGESICEKHAKELEEANLQCVLCNGVHRLASGDRFPENKALKKMLKVNMPKLDFGAAYNEAKQQVQNVENVQRKLRHAISEPGDHVASFTQKYINQVDLAREEMIKIVDDACYKMKLLIISFKSDCEARIRNELSSLIDLQKRVDIRINTWKEKLDLLVVNEPLWQEITNQAKFVQEKVDSKLNEKAFQVPFDLEQLIFSVKREALTQLSEHFRTQDINLFDKENKKSVLIRDVSKIAKSQEWESLYSKEFMIQGFPFDLSVEFSENFGQMSLGAFLNSKSSHIRETIELSWMLNVYGKYQQLITQKYDKYEYNEAIGSGWPMLISLNDIMAHPAYDAAEDMVWVEVEIDEKSIKVKQANTIQRR